MQNKYLNGYGTYYLSILSLCLVYLSALAQPPRTGIALAPVPAWATHAPTPYMYPTDSTTAVWLNRPHSRVVAAAVQPDGALQVLTALKSPHVFAGRDTGGVTQDSLRLYNVRFSPDGQLDTKHGRSGWVECAIPYNTNIRNICAVLQTDGKWLVAFDFTYDKDVSVMRFEPNGRLDTTFRRGGYVYFTNDPSKEDELLGLSLLPDGKIHIFVSSRYESPNRYGQIWRLNPDGMFDTTLGRDRVLTLADRYWIAACRMLPDGRFVLVSYNGDWVRVERYLPDGRPDLGYGRFGQVHSRIETLNDDYLTLWPDGSLILHGYESTLCETGRLGSVFRSRRFDPTGRPDTLAIAEPLTSSPASPQVINDTTWMAFSNANAEGEVACFYDRYGRTYPHRLHFSGIFSWEKQVVPSPDGGPFIVDTWDGLLRVARLLPNGRLNLMYGLDSATIAAQGYIIRTTEQPEKTSVELRETNPLPSPFNVTVIKTKNVFYFTGAYTRWVFDGNVRTCYSTQEIDAPYLVGKNLNLCLQDCVFPVKGTDWSAVPAERLLGLSLTNCRFEGSIPAELRRFKQLQLLEICYDSSLTDFQRHLDEALRLIPLFPRLKCLVIHAPGMTEVPKSLKKLREIVSIELNIPQLKQFPDAVLRMKKLRALRLTFRCPDGLPPAIGRLDSLQLLELTGSGPESRLQLPESLGRLQSLKELRLTDGALSCTLPESAGALQQLEKFGVVNAGISALPDSLGACSRLTEVVILSAGNFERLPKGLSYWPNLTRLKIEVCNPTPYLRQQCERLRRQGASQNRWFEIRVGEW
ncbi:MAG: hypothetical protein SFV52_13310 [Saprospiraceae bacterium]|nr:hypothetical protein [Saprospiraceae bacterium]